MALTTIHMSPLERVCRRIDEISTLPHVAIRLMEVASNPDVGPRELKKVMESDASLSMRILRCVNSSAYALRTKITNLQSAIGFLGVKQIRNLAVTASVSQLFAEQDLIGRYSRKQLWTHLVSVGVCARMIAMRVRVSDFEDVFIAGLLHDIGLVLEDQHAHPEFVKVMESLEEGHALCKAEQEHLGFDHTRLGEDVAKSWKLPQGAIDTIRYHHDSSAYRGQHTKTVHCVEVANFLCTLKGVSSVGIKLVQVPQTAIAALTLKRDDLVVLAADFDAELARNQTLLQV